MIAEAIADSIDSDLLELKPVKELDPNSGMRFFWGGYQATMKKKPKLKEFDVNPLDYDLIFLGTPVWAWNITPPIRSFLSIFNLSGKKIALWTCSDGDGIKAMSRFKEVLKGSKIIGEIRFKKPKQNKPNQAKEQARAWAKGIIG